jgi:hypothetical protein
MERRTVSARRIVMKRRTVLGCCVAVSTCLILVAGCASLDSNSESDPAGGTTAAAADAELRWVGLRGVEVQAPADWANNYEAVRPDCIDPDSPQNDPWARDVPDAPYVAVGTPNRPVPLIGCLRQRESGDPGVAFGDLPFSLWQPFVKLEQARPDLEDPGRADGHWQYRDWQLTRDTIDGVQVTVLAPPDTPALGRDVMGSARQMETTSLGCGSTSPVLAEQFAQPSGGPVPAAKSVAAIAVCEYSRTPGSVGLEGSRRITGPEARDLVEAINDAPHSGGPDRPQHCVRDMYGDRAIALRFFARREETTAPLAEAYVYYDWCFGNGIVDAQGVKKLTRANCAPLFAEAPISLWSGQKPIVEACGPLGVR